MKEPAWVLPQAVEAIHKRQVAEHGGEPGIRDPNLLDSALSRPRNLHAYSDTETSIPALAAAYAFGIAKNHAFNDGNKRTAMVVALTFLRINGYALEAGPEERYVKFEGIASGRVTERALAKWLEANCKVRRGSR